jgi:hypothetical protein
MGAPLHTSSASETSAGLGSAERPDHGEDSVSSDLPQPLSLSVAELEVIETFLAKVLDELFNI